MPENGTAFLYRKAGRFFQGLTSNDITIDNMPKFVLSVLFLFFSVICFAQTVGLKGTLLDDDKKPIPSATVRLTGQGDTLINYNIVTNTRGIFEFKNLEPGVYILLASSIGYDSLRQTILLSETKDLGKLTLYKSSQILGEVTVTASTPPVKQKGDTLEYSASAFKVNPDALMEDMIKKMPGVTVDRSGTVTAQGETVKKITIDGRDFFGDDATAALRNLPAEVIDKIQVFDRLSDQAQFTGFDDGNTTKAINIVTKADMRNGQFGRVYAGYGTDNRYTAGGNMSFFKDNRRVSLVGLFNNVNQQNFGSQDLLGVTSGGGGGRRGGGRGGVGRGGGGGRGWGQSNNFEVGQQSGISKTNAFGINYTDLWGKKMEVTGSYFFNNSSNSNNESSSQYLIADSTQSYVDKSLSTSKNYNHRLNMRLEYKIDSSNSITFTPNLSFQTNKSISQAESFSYDLPDLLSRASTFNDMQRDGYNLRSNLLYRHAFPKKGRTFSANFSTAFNKNNGDVYYQSENSYNLNIKAVRDSLDQYNDQVSNGYTLGGSLSYTEPVGKAGQVELSYNPSYSYSKSDQLTYNYNEATKGYHDFIDSLSNKFDNVVTSHRTGLSYRIGGRGNMISFGLSYQYSELGSNQVFPESLNISRSYNNILPNAMISKKLSPKSSVRLFYRASTNAPSVSQLQNVFDISNPLQWNTGNPDLKQQISNMVSARYTYTNSLSGSSFFANVFVQNMDNYINTATFRAAADSIEANFPDTLRKGSQLSKPVNLNGYWSVRSFLNYGLPVKFIKSTLNLNGGYTFSRLPGLTNNEQTISNSNNYSLGAVLASNISEYVDFNLSYSANFNSVKNRSQPAANTNYFSSNTGIQANMLSKSGWVLQNDLSNQFYSGLTDGYNQNFWIWNMSIGKKFLAQQKAELKLSVFDLLKQSQSIVRNVTGTYIEDVQNQVLQQYFMLTFTYKLKNFGKKKADTPRFPEGREFNYSPTGERRFPGPERF